MARKSRAAVRGWLIDECALAIADAERELLEMANDLTPVDPAQAQRARERILLQRRSFIALYDALRARHEQRQAQKQAWKEA